MIAAAPFPANYGTPAAIAEMALAVSELGHDVHVVTYHTGEGEPPPGVTIHRIRGGLGGRHVVVGPTWQKPLLDLQLLIALVRLVRRADIDVIHAHNYEGGLVGGLARLLTGKPVVYNAVNTMVDELGSYGFIRPRFLADGLARFLDWFVPRLSDCTIAISEELADFLRRRGIPDRCIHVIPLGVYPEMFEGADGSEIRERYGLGGGPLVLYTGTLNRLQRLDYLLRALSVVAAELSTVRVVIAANASKPEDEGYYWDLARELGVEGHLRIIHLKDFSEVPAFLAAAEVSVIPRPECPGFPVKLLNSLASGCPVVTFAGSAKGIRDGDSAALAPDHDWRALGAAIVRVLTDRPFAARLSENGRREVRERFSWPRLASRAVSVYRELLPVSVGAVASRPRPER